MACLPCHPLLQGPFTGIFVFVQLWSCYFSVSMAPHKEDPDPENSFNNFDNASTVGIMTPQGHVRNRCKRCTALLCSTVGVVCILLSYVICGAIVFSNLEGSTYGTGTTITLFDRKHGSIRPRNISN